MITAHQSAATADEHGAPVNRMIRLIQNHRPRHYESIVQNPLPGILFAVDVREKSLVLARHVVKRFSAARVALDKVCEQSHGHVGPIVLLDDLQEGWERI